MSRSLLSPSLSLSTLVSASALLLPLAQAFTFSHTNGSQCRDITLQWDGGEGPFYATVVPSWSEPGARIQNVTIPSSSAENGQHTFRLDQVAGSQYTIVMSDSTGWGAGGVTPILRSQPSTDTSCIGPMVGFDFYFYLTPPEAPTRSQCASFGITWDMSITYPLQLLALVPGSSAFSIPVPQTPNDTSITWDLAVREGAQFQLLMANAGLYGTGGAINMTNVTSGSSACLNSNSPGVGTGEVTVLTSIGGSRTASLSRTGSLSASGSPSSSSSATSSNDGSGMGSTSSSDNTGAIAGGVVGGVLALALLGLLLFCLRRRRNRQAQENAKDNDDMPYPPMRQTSDMAGSSSFDILARPTGDGDSPLYQTPPSSDGGRNGDGGDGEPFVSPFPAPARNSRASLDMDGRGPVPWGAAGGAAGQRNSGSFLDGTQPDSAAATENYGSGLGLAAPAGGAAAAGLGGLGAFGHSRNASHDTANTFAPGTMGSNRNSRKVSGTMQETAPASPTVRSQFSSGVPVGAGAGTGAAQSSPGMPSRHSRGMWSAENMDLERFGEEQYRRSSADVRFIQHEDSDVVELPPQYNQLRTRNPDQNA